MLCIGFCYSGSWFIFGLGTTGHQQDRSNLKLAAHGQVANGSAVVSAGGAGPVEYKPCCSGVYIQAWHCPTPLQDSSNLYLTVVVVATTYAFKHRNYHYQLGTYHYHYHRTLHRKVRRSR